MERRRLRAVIVDDEPLARERLRQLVSQSGRVEIVGDARDGVEGLGVIDRTNPDVAFVDVEMPELDGLAVAQQLCGAHRPAVGFVTAYDRYAVAAFETRAVDYLLEARQGRSTHSRPGPRHGIAACTRGRRLATAALSRPGGSWPAPVS